MSAARLVLALALAAPHFAAAAPAAAPAAEERLRAAKTLYFDKKYAEAREAWTKIRAGGGADVETAAFWIARSSHNLGEHERALLEYGDFLSLKPSDATLSEEARTGRIGLATDLYKAGRKQHLSLVQQGLKDPSKTVRYLAALKLGSLGPEVGRLAVPVLKSIVAEEADEDLVDRAKLALLKVDPRALSETSAERTPPRTLGAATREAGWLKVRIYERGRSEPKVQINLPVALADLAFKSLPADALRELRRKGYDAENFWDRLKKLGPTEILEIVGDDGERIKIWIE